MYLNSVELIGFLGNDAESKTTPNRKAVTTLSLATKTSFLKSNERQQRTEWHRIQVWGKLGEYAAAFKKGSHLCVEGELRSREYETEGGTKVRTYHIVANSILNLRSGNNAAEPDTAEASDAEPPAAPAPAAEPVAEKKAGKSRRKPKTEERP
jgi:single-strand DNA-binding protein